MKRTSTMLSSNRITIPKHIRARLGWKPGQTIKFIPKGRGCQLTPIEKTFDSDKTDKEADTK